MKETGIYIHVPYCKGKCLYCDFFSGGVALADFEKFSSSIIGELKERKKELQGFREKFFSVPSTLYIGGGSPSILPGDILIDLVNQLREVVEKHDDWVEFTIEVNPEDVTEEKCLVWAECGVNRVSMGVQSLNDDELKRIGRRHDSRKALEALELLKQHFSNVNIDLIFGLPGQTLGSWRNSIEGILKMKPQHISGYSLMFEQGTPISVLREQGRMTFPGEDECVEMWKTLSDLTKEEGYTQYELSNYALPGKESRHNQRYWLGNPYLGLGPSAHSFDGVRTRRANPNRIREYISRFGGKSTQANETQGKEKLKGNNSVDRIFYEEKDLCVGTFYEEEILSDEELQEEMIMLSMRMRRGLDLNLFRNRFGEVAYARLMKNSNKEIKAGLIETSANFLRLTDAGIMVSDEVILNLIL